MGPVTYFEDESQYSYIHDEDEFGVLNIGWLDASQDYNRGSVSSDFIERLEALCALGTCRTRGWHACNLCPPDAPYPAMVDSNSGNRYPVGDAEIRVPGRGGITYAAPTMMVHYVKDHGYRPPEEFIDVVLEL
jgi:hypothetical protein